ncbi:hypothetical protein [Prochlorococcus sp. MIT 1307]|uniref:hypothetical protein n=1 Tax=Prochlorococcus sp. MIT 1307 TaxID=3096219 RepID=UPI002A74D911|nr:hypothetical protein [Prochlorococcus sp. MIT 1307]
MIDIAINYRFFAKFILFTLSVSSFSCMLKTDEDEAYLKSEVNIGSCLESLDGRKLQKGIDTCSKVIEKFPNNATALSERSLLYTINGQNTLACLDIKKALKIIQDEKLSIDPLVKYQSQIRHNSCKKR